MLITFERKVPRHRVHTHLKMTTRARAIHLKHQQQQKSDKALIQPNHFNHQKERSLIRYYLYIKGAVEKSAHAIITDCENPILSRSISRGVPIVDVDKDKALVQKQLLSLMQGLFWRRNPGFEEKEIGISEQKRRSPFGEFPFLYLLL